VHIKKLKHKYTQFIHNIIAHVHIAHMTLLRTYTLYTFIIAHIK